MAATKTEEKARERKTVARNSVVLEESVNNRWRAIVPAGTTVEDLKDPQFWATRASEFHAYDRIIVVDREQTAWHELLVVDCAVGWADVVLLQTVKLPPKQSSNGPRLPEGFEVVREIEGFRIRRLKDGVFMTPPRLREADAVGELLEHATLRA